MATARGECVLRDPAFAPLKQAVIALTGLGYWCDKDDLLAERLAVVVGHGGSGLDSLLRRLTAEHGHGPASEAVIGAVTVGETFFFRYAAQFEALERHVLPEVMARNHAARTLSLWSAGCSNGAEPYSLSILLRRRFAALLAGWRVDILGSDINVTALAEARAGEYGAWTIRDLPDELRYECFLRHGDRWRVKPRFRQDVRFLRHNLVTQAPPSGGFDVVLCRNVLMYFDAATRDRVLWALRLSLVPGGWLLVGHAEVSPEVAGRFTPVVLPGCTVYRRPEDGP